MTDPVQILQQVFGFKAFLPGQGKSLCYQLPALHLSGLTLVISPLTRIFHKSRWLQMR